MHLAGWGCVGFEFELFDNSCLSSKGKEKKSLSIPFLQVVCNFYVFLVCYALVVFCFSNLCISRLSFFFCMRYGAS